MQNIPSKLQSVEQFKPAVVRKINDLIDYLHSQRIITDGKTIKANYGYNGISLHCQLKTSNNEEVLTPFNHPWKMTIITDELGTKKLKIEDARIQIDGGTPDRLYYQGFQIALPQQEDTYYVVGYAVHDPDFADGSIGVEYTGGFFYLSSQATTADISNTFGFHTFVIGTIIVEQIENQNSSSTAQFNYKVDKQYYTSVFNLYDDLATQNFGIHIVANTYPLDGDVLTDFLGDTVIINGGQVFLDDLGIVVQDYDEQINGTRLFCVQINTGAKTAEITSFGLNEWVFQEEGIYNVPLAVIRQGIYGYNIEVFLYGAFHFRIGGKVLLNENDGVHGYLQDKLKYEISEYDNLSSDEKEIYVPQNRYIRGITHNDSSSSSVGTSSLYDQIYFDYSKIPDWAKNKDYVLNSERGQLKWQDWKSKVSSSDDKGYLNTKFEDTQGVHWTFSGNKIHATIQGLGKVKVNAADVADYLESKLTASKGDITLSVEIPQESSSSGESSSSVQPMSQVIDISLNVQGTGLLFYDNGTLSVVEHPQNNAVLAWINNEFRWIELSDCQNACSSESSSSSSLN